MYTMPEIDQEAAARYNADKDVPIDDVADFQAEAGITIDGKWGPQTVAHWRQSRLELPAAEPDKDKIVGMIADFEGNYWSVNKDGEYRGLFGQNHWAYQKTHLGLSWGFLQFNQRAGSLGECLAQMQKADPGLFKETFVYPDELVAVTNRPRGQVVDGRNRRVQPVAGKDLWEQPWVRRFQKAGQKPVFQMVQRDYAQDEYMAPAVETVEGLNLQTERALAMAFDRSIQHGPTGARNLFDGVHEGQPEHIFLYDCLTAWQDQSWGHRPETLYHHPQLRDT